MFIKHVVIDIFILYYSFLFYYAIFMGMDYRTETVGVTFSQYSPACKKEFADSHPNFYSWAANEHISEANEFCSATTKHSVRKNNFNFLLYNLLHD